MTVTIKSTDKHDEAKAIISRLAARFILHIVDSPGKPFRIALDAAPIKVYQRIATALDNAGIDYE